MWFLFVREAGREQTWKLSHSSFSLLPLLSLLLAPSHKLWATGAPSWAPACLCPRSVTWVGSPGSCLHPVSVMAASRPLPGTQAGPSESPLTVPLGAVIGNSDVTRANQNSGFLPWHLQPSPVQLVTDSLFQLL